MSVKLSVIIPTLGRKESLCLLLDSFAKSIGDISYEIIIVDQNEDGLIDDVCYDFSKFLNLHQYKVLFKGLSKAKNFGVEQAIGEYVCFPDDDAEFCENTICLAMQKLDTSEYDCIFGKCIDKSTKTDSVIKFISHEQILALSHFEGTFVEATMFAKRAIFLSYKYDEKMGAGSIFGSQEGYDLVYRLLLDDKKMLYSPEIVFFHPNKVTTRNSDEEMRRAFYYSCGFGYLCQKHGFSKKYIKRLIKLKIGIIGISIFKPKEKKYYKAQVMGITLGYDYLK